MILFSLQRPWEWHVPICVEAMKTGSHAATEVPAALTMDECWELVETSEKHNKTLRYVGKCLLYATRDDDFKHSQKRIVWETFTW